MLRRLASLPVSLAVIAAAACSTVGSPPSEGGIQSGLLVQRLGAAPGTSLSLRYRNIAAPAYAKRFLGLFVSDLDVKQGQGGVWLFAQQTYARVGKLTDGMDLPDGSWFDLKHNFYVANVDAQDVTEYAPGSRRPACTYSGANDPTNVKTDSLYNVYVNDWNVGHSGAIDVYQQCRNTMTKRYTFGSSAPSDEAFDATGDMFVMYLVSGSGPGALEEFPSGSMTPKPLGATVKFPGALLLDKHGNLIAADQGTAGSQTGAIDIIAPPYAKAKPLVSKLAQPVFLSLNRRETLLFADSFDFDNPTVWVFAYPSGKLLTTLGAANGLAYPLGVAAAPDDTH
jgi:hypothetical protein